MRSDFSLNTLLIVFNTSTVQEIGCLKKNLNAPRPSEHPPVRGKKCQNVEVGSIIAENTKTTVS